MRGERWLWLKIIVFILVFMGAYPVSYRVWYGRWPASSSCG